MRRALVSALAVLALVAAGCSAPQGPGPTQPPATAQGEDLEALRLEHGLPDCPPTDPDAEAADKGLPATALPCLGSDEVVNLAGLERRATVVNFWAQWCGPCREEAPFLRDAAGAHDDVAFLGINFDDPEPALAIEFAGLAEWPYPHVRDESQQLKRIGVAGLPATFFIDADGRIIGRHLGVIESDEQLADLLREHLGVA